MIEAIRRFRKKYTLALLLFIVGSTHSFMFAWTATEFTAFAALLLGIFGTTDLVDKKVVTK